MDKHVMGQPTIGELRQSILAALVGNPRFTEEEQLLANHMTYECEDVERLERWLRNVRREDVKRSHLARYFAARVANIEQSVCVSEKAHLAELDALLNSRLLDKWQKRTFSSLMTGVGNMPGSRIQCLGHAYLNLLENIGRVPKPQGWDALKDN